MKLQVKKLGIIEDGIVDLNHPLTIFCGPNGTGKTYLSYLIYALVCDNLSPLQPLSNEDMDKLAEDGIVCVSISEDNAISFRKTTVEILKSRVDELYGISKKSASKIFKDFDLIFLSSDDEYVESIRKMSITISINLTGSSFKIAKKRGAMEFTLRRDKRQSADLETLQAIRILTSMLIYQRFLTHGITSAHIFTVERSSIFTFNKELLLSRNKLVDLVQDRLSNNRGTSAQVSNIFESNSNRYPLPIRHNIRFAADLTQIKKEESEYSNFADELEKSLLHGNHVDVDSDGNVVIQVGKSLTLPIHMGASVAKTLAPLILTLRHNTQKGDMLIIDEPELNLHPAAQILFARILARMINKGLRILISTHSDYIIREINNLIMWGNISDKNSPAFKESGYMSSETLNKNQVGVYVFNYSSSPKESVRIENVPVDREGFAIKTIDDAIRSLNESAENAYAAIIGQEKRQ